MNRIRLLVFFALAPAVFGLIVIAQRSQTRPAQPAQRSPAAAARIVQRLADPNRAPQALADQALFASELFFGERVSVPRPFAEALQLAGALEARYPKDAALKLQVARLDERLGRFGEAAKEMQEYVKLRNSSPASLRRLAAFYHKRALYSDEVRTLGQLAKASPVTERAPAYRRMISLARDHQLKEFDGDTFCAEMIAGDPANFELVKNYAETLLGAKRYSKALEVLDSYQPQHESELRFFLRQRARVLEEQGNRAAAIDSYSKRFSPVWPRGVASDFYELLRRYGKYRDYRRDLQVQVRQGGADFEAAGRLFNIYAYESNIPYAAHTLAAYEERASARAAGTGLPPRELEQLAEMYGTIGYYDQASRYLYTLYLTGTLAARSQAREDALARLFHALLDAGNTQTRIGSGDLKFYRDVAAVDQNPGILNGVLSLILSGTNPAEEYRQEEAKAAGYFNRAFAYRIFTTFKQEYPSSARLPGMYAGMITAFAGFGEHKLAAALGREFQAKFPKAGEYAGVSERIADSYVALKDRNNERIVLGGLLDHLAAEAPKDVPLLPVISSGRSNVSPASEDESAAPEDAEQRYSDEVFDPAEGGGSSPDYSPYVPPEYDYAGREITPPRVITYSQILERVVSSYASDNQQAGALKFFWGEIKKHPKEEGLYERFLRWLGQTNLIAEQLKAYTAAINEYDDQTWYGRLARWYLRQKRTNAFLIYSRQLLEVFDDEETQAYLSQFRATASSLQGGYDQTLGFQLYRLAHSRFPQNTEFVKGLLGYYASREQWAGWQRLLTEYYFSGRDFRDQLLVRYGQLDVLRARLEEARAHREQLSYRHFAADAALWLSHFEDALDTSRELAKIYPGEPAYVERLADLTRSLDSNGGKLGVEAAAAWSSLADIYPTLRSYRTKAGETLAEMGNFAEARAQWDQLLEHERGNPDAYREVASIYWDYFQWDDAIRTIEELRASGGQPHALAYELAALFEGKNNFSKAITEYVATLGDGSADEAKAMKRLVQLAPRRNYKNLIASAYQSRAEAEPANGSLALSYAKYLADANRAEESYALLRREAARSNDFGFLESARDIFHANSLSSDEQAVISRLIAAARDVREQMKYRLQLASFYEAGGRDSEAGRTFDELVAGYPTNLGVIQEADLYYKRSGQFEKAIGLYQGSIPKARGPYQREFTLALASRQIDAKKLNEAETTLRDLYGRDPLDTEAFGRLVRVLGDEGKDEALLDLYRTGLGQIRKAGLDRDTETDRTAQLRFGMIATLAKLKRPTDVADQYIEIINRQPEDSTILARALAYAGRNGQLDRLRSYYQDTSAKSFKDYRWNLVLARMAEARGDYAESGAQYQKCVLNEPQRLDFRSSLADSLIRQGKHGEAITELRKAAALDSGNTQWLMRIASVQVQQGKRDEAAATLRAALASRKNILAARVFGFAASLRSWGLSKEALAFYQEGIKRYFENPYEQSLPSEAVNGFVDCSIKNAGLLETAQALDSILQRLDAESKKDTNYEKYKIESAQRVVTDAAGKVFAKQVAAYGTSSELRELASYYKDRIAPIRDYSEDSQKQLRRYASIGRNSLLAEVQEAALTRLADNAFAQYRLSAAWQPNSGAGANSGPVPLITRRMRRQSFPPGTYASSETRVAAQHYYQECLNLLDFYDTRAAFEKSATFLEASYQRDPVKDRFDYFGETAWRYQLLGRPELELAALRKFYNSQTGILTQDTSLVISRYLELLYQAGSNQSRTVSLPAAPNELRELAGKYNPYQLQLINFLIDHKEEALALEAIAHAEMPRGWIASRSAQVALYFRDRTSRAEGFFQGALDTRTIGDFAGSPRPPGGELSAHDWYWTARSYGMWLRLSENRAAEGRRYLPGLIERRPRDFDAQLQLASYYLGAKQLTEASDHIALAEELAPGNSRVLAAKGEVLFANGKSREAAVLWQSIAERKGATLADAELYFDLMRSHKLVKESLTAIERYLAQAIPKAESFELLKPFIREVAYSAYADDPQQTYTVVQAIGPSGVTTKNFDPATSSAIQTMLRNLANRAPSQLLLPEMALNEHLVPDPARGEFFKLVIAREESKELALRSSGQDPDSYSEWNGSEYIQPMQSLNRWRTEYINYLIEEKAYTAARAEIARVRAAERSRKKDNYADPQAASAEAESGDQPVEDDWLALAEGKVALREGKVADAARLLRQFAEIGIDASEAGTAAPPNKQRAVAASMLLQQERQGEAASDLMSDAYSQLIASGQREDPNYAGLAELEFRRGNGPVALSHLKTMADLQVGNAQTLELAASTAARYRSFDAALEYRQRARDLNREDAENRLELARTLAALDRREEAIDEIRGLAEDHTSSNTSRAAAVLTIPEVVKADQALAGRLLDRFRSQGAARGAFTRLIEAELLDLSGRSAEAGPLFQSAANESGSPLASVLLGTYEGRHGDRNAAAAAFERALYQDPEGTTTQTLAFAGSVPSEALIRAYSEAGRDAAALEVARQSASYGLSPAASDDEGGVIYSSYQEGSILSSGPDGWFVELYLYPLYTPPPSSLFKIPPGHGPLETSAAVLQLDSNSSAKYRTIAEQNLDASVEGRRSALRLLSQAALRQGEFQDAVDYERARRPLLASSELIGESNNYLVSLLGKQREEEKRLLAQVRLDKSFTDEPKAGS